MELRVEKATTPKQMQDAFDIRRRVFVVEQNVSADLEYDEFEESSKHYLCLAFRQAVGTARWRATDKGIKLERFAVLKEWRGKGIGQALLERVLSDVKEAHHYAQIYLHAQITALKFYGDAGFKVEGEEFIEAGVVEIHGLTSFNTQYQTWRCRGRLLQIDSVYDNCLDLYHQWCLCSR